MKKASSGRSIRQFQANPAIPIFTQATYYPQFFNRHLVHKNRRIKVFRDDPNANIRVFYFQYLMLCYQIQNQNFQYYISKLHNFVLDPTFTFLFLDADDPEIFNHQQFKHFLLEFTEILDSGQFESTQAALSAYPIADTVLLYFFRSLTIYAQLTEGFTEYIEKTMLFGFLLQQFNIDAQMFEDKCIKFIQAEVFVYEETQRQVYMVYKDIQSIISQATGSKIQQTQNITNKYQEQENMLRIEINSIISSKKQDKQSEACQNISFLDQQQNINDKLQHHRLQSKHLRSHSQDVYKQNTAQHNVNSSKKIADDSSLIDSASAAFKKNKLIDSQEAYNKMKSEFLQKPSVLSNYNDELQGTTSQQSRLDASYSNDDKIPTTNIRIANNHVIRQLPNQSLQQSESRSWKQNPYYPQQTASGQANNNNVDHKFEIRSINRNNNNDLHQNKYLNHYDHEHHHINQYQWEIGTQGSANISQINPVASKLNQPKDNLTLNINNVSQNIKSRNGKSETDLLARLNEQLNSKLLIPSLGNTSKINYTIETINQNYYGTNLSEHKQPITNMSQNKHMNSDSNKMSSQNTQIQYDYLPKQIKSQKNIESQKYRADKLPNTGNSQSSLQNNEKLKGKHNVHQNRDLNTLHNAEIIQNTARPSWEIPTRDYQWSYHTEIANKNNTKSSNISGQTTSRQSFALGMGSINHSNSHRQIILEGSDAHTKKQHNLNTSKSQHHPDYIYGGSNYKSSTYSGYDAQNDTYLNLHSQQPRKQANILLKQQQHGMNIITKQFISSKLSISKQFTDSLTLAKMGEPYNTNIKRMKTRSRETRQSIISLIK